MMLGQNRMRDTPLLDFPDTQVFFPWRRYLARTLDLFLYNLLWMTFLGLVCRVNLATLGSMETIFNSFAAIGLMLVCEPVLLHLFFATPGKAVFGLRVTAPDGGRLTYRMGLERTWGVIGAGMGYNLPVYNLIRLWKSYQLCKEHQPQLWDETVRYSIRDTKRYRAVVYAVAWAALLGLFAVVIGLQRLPPNCGELTVEQFAENYHYYASYFGIDMGEDYLDEKGKWAKKPSGGTVYIDVYANIPPNFVYTVENDKLTGISFAVELHNSEEWLYSYNRQIMLASLAFAGAQKEVGIFSGAMQQIVEQIEKNTFKSFNFIQAGISFTCNTEFSGYTSFSPEIGLLIPDENTSENSYTVEFSMQKA